MSQSLGVVVPAYCPDINRLHNYINTLDQHLSPQTILIEIDKPQPRILESLIDLPIKINTSPQRRGKGKAITDGFETLETDILAFVDADGATPAPSFKKVIDHVRAGQADIAVGSRRHPNAKVRTHQTVVRRYLGNTFALTARLLLEVPLYDYQCGAKAIMTKAWDSIRNHLYASGFSWDVELIAAAGALNLCIKEVPIEWHDSPGSTVSPVYDSLRLAKTLVAARHRAKCIENSQLHKAIADCRTKPLPLIHRENQY